MKSPREGRLRPIDLLGETCGTSLKPERKRAAERALDVTDVVQRGTGERSRIDLTVVFSGRPVRLTLPARHVLSYRRIAQAAIEQRMVLPYFRYADETWREVLAPAMEKARVEPWLEGEEIAEAIAEEIRALVKSSPCGESASDLSDGKVVVRKNRWVVSAERLVQSVRGRLVDDVLPRLEIAEAAVTHLGMRKMRPNFAAGRRRAWSFPLSIASARENRDAEERGVDGSTIPAEPVEESEALRETADSIHPGAMEVEARWIRSMDQNEGPRSPLPTERSEPDPVVHEKRRISVDPVPGPELVSEIPFSYVEMPAESSGPRKTKSHVGSGPWIALLGGISDNEMGAGSSGPAKNPFPGPGLSITERSDD